VALLRDKVLKGVSWWDIFANGKEMPEMCSSAQLDSSMPLFFVHLVHFIQKRLLSHERDEGHVQEVLERYFPDACDSDEDIQSDDDDDDDDDDGFMQEIVQDHHHSFHQESSMSLNHGDGSNQDCDHHHHYASSVPNHFTTRTFLLICAIYLKHANASSMPQQFCHLLHQMIEMEQYQMMIIEFLCMNPEVSKAFWVKYGEKMFFQCVHSVSIYHQRLSVPMFWIGNKVHKIEWRPAETSSSADPLSSMREHLNFIFLLMDCAFPCYGKSEGVHGQFDPYDATDEFLDDYVYPNLESSIEKEPACILSLWKSRGESFVLQSLLSRESPAICVDILHVAQNASMTEIPFSIVHQLLSDTAPINHHLNALRCMQLWDFNGDATGCTRRILQLWNDALYHQADVYSPQLAQLLTRPTRPFDEHGPQRAHFDEQYAVECIQAVAFQLDCSAKHNTHDINLQQLETTLYCTIELFLHSRYKVVMCAFQMLSDQLKSGNRSLCELLQDRVRPLLMRKAPHLSESRLFALCIEILYFSAESEFDREQFSELLHESLFNMNWEMRETVFTFLFENGLGLSDGKTECSELVKPHVTEWLPQVIQQRLKADTNTAVRFAAIRCMDPVTMNVQQLESILESMKSENGGDPFLRQRVFNDLFCSPQWTQMIDQKISKANTSTLLLYLLVHIYNGFEFDTMINVAKFIICLEKNIPLLQKIIFECSGDGILQEILDNAYFSELLVRGELIDFLKRIQNQMDGSRVVSVKELLSKAQGNLQTKSSSEEKDVLLFFNHTQDQDCYD